jgi:hypothetical protein
MSVSALSTDGNSEEAKTVYALHNASKYFLLYSLFDAWMVVCAAIQLWALSAPPDCEVALMFVGSHPDTSALSQMGLVITGMCFSCDVVIGITVVNRLRSITEKSIVNQKVNWSDVSQKVSLNWFANLVTLVIWLGVKIMLFRNGGWARIFGLVFVCIIRAGKIFPLWKFKNSIEPIWYVEEGEEPSFQLLHDQWHGEESHTDVMLRKVAKGCGVVWVVVLIACAVMVYSSQEPEEGTVVYAATPSPPLTAAPSLRQLEHSTFPPQSSLDNVPARVLMSKTDLKAGIVKHGAMWCCPQVHNCGLDGNVVASYFQGDVAACSDSRVAKHVFHHKAANAAKAAGGGAVSAGLTCAAMASETGPGAIVAGSACGLAAGLGLGGAVYVSLSEPDDCLDECSSLIPSDVAEILFCTPSPDQCRAGV